MQSTTPAPTRSRLRQAVLPITMLVLVVLLVVFALVADERRECRQICLKQGFADFQYLREGVSGDRCRCVDRAGNAVPPMR